MVKNLFFLAAIPCVCVSTLAEDATEVPPIPEGYANDRAVTTAILLGRLKLIDANNVSTPDSVEEIRDIEYGTGGKRKLKLDLYLPKHRTEVTPAIMFIHGGAWKDGKRGDMKFYCVKFAEKGYVTATVTYRLTGEAPFPAAVHDVKCAVRWLRANAAKYHIDPERIAVSGNSAGGHLAMMIGYSDDPQLEGSGGNNGFSSRVCAVVDFYGPADLTTAYAREQAVVKDFTGGKTFAHTPETYKMASPLFHLTPDDPPTLIFHGTIDSQVPIAQADRLDDKLKDLGIDHVYERYEGWPHVMDLAEAVNRRCIYQMEQFFGKYVSGKTPEPAAGSPPLRRAGMAARIIRGLSHARTGLRLQAREVRSEHLPDLPGRLVPFAGGLLKQPFDSLSKAVRYIRVELLYGAGRFVYHTPNDCDTRVSTKRRPSGRHCVENTSKPEEVRAVIHRIAPRLFRRHVLGSSSQYPGLGDGRIVNCARKPEVGNLHPFDSVLKENV